MPEVALFGGSFNPAHVGHVQVVAQVLAVEPVEAVWLLPTHTHAFGKNLAPFEARAEMCRAIAELFGNRVRVCTVESELAAAGRENRTVDTLEALAERNPDTRFALVIGTDLLAEVETWKSPARLRELARFIVVNRAGHEDPSAGPVLPDVSSTRIREQLARGEPVDRWVPHEVLAICRRRGLFGAS